MVVSPSKWLFFVAENGPGSSPSSFRRAAAEDLLHGSHHVFRTELLHQLLQNWGYSGGHSAGHSGGHSAGHSAGHPSALRPARRTVAWDVVILHAIRHVIQHVIRHGGEPGLLSFPRNQIVDLLGGHGHIGVVAFEPVQFLFTPLSDSSQQVRIALPARQLGCGGRTQGLAFLGPRRQTSGAQEQKLRPSFLCVFQAGRGHRVGEPDVPPTQGRFAQRPQTRRIGHRISAGQLALQLVGQRSRDLNRQAGVFAQRAGSPQGGRAAPPPPCPRPPPLPPCAAPPPPPLKIYPPPPLPPPPPPPPGGEPH